MNPVGSILLTAVSASLAVLVLGACGQHSPGGADAGAVDAGPVDAGRGDGGEEDAGPPDAGPPGWIGASGFTMGCLDSDPPGCLSDTLPAHEVALSSYWMDLTEVSQAAFQGCVASGACQAPQVGFDPVANADLPVRFVTWDQADGYCRWSGGRLPTEAQWEKVARSGQGSPYPWGTRPPSCDLANFADCGGVPLAVDSQPGGVSSRGVLGLDGNVREWVADYYAYDAYATSAAQDPTGPAMGFFRVQRGGGFATVGGDLVVSRRVAGNPGVAYTDVGFRCVRSP